MQTKFKNEVVYLDGNQIRERLGGRSRMWLWRLTESDEAFPKPVVIRGRNYWRLADLLAWEASHA